MTPRSITILLLVAAVLAAFLYLATGPGRAHSWYDYACCSEGDCEPLAEGTVKATPIGWFIGATGETIPFADGRVRDSQDIQFHRCRRADGKTRCLYVPAVGG